MTQLKILEASTAKKLEAAFNTWTAEIPRGGTFISALPLRIGKMWYLFVFYQPPR